MEPGCTAHIGPIWVPIWDPYKLLAGLLTAIVCSTSVCYIWEFICACLYVCRWHIRRAHGKFLQNKDESK